MKKIVLTLLLVAGFTAFGQKNKLNFGIHGGIPVGVLNKSHSAAFGFDASYLFAITDQIDIGVASGFIYFSGEDGIEEKSYIPIAAAFRFNNDADRWFVQGDFGFAAPIAPEGDRGGLYFKPMIGYNFTKRFNLNASFVGVQKKKNNAPTFSYIALGVMFRI